ncbi:MAG TPA: phospholipase D-like domain-containing protein [Wenzhouxiangellaceae bacterium]|nr:phospholipase D-like domain-containing protein [Wenzhouxiangellaceae bacterium]
MPEPQTLLDFSLIAVLFHLVISPLAALHAMMFKRDSRAALGWIALCLLLPVVGPVLYTILGINRIRRRARRLELPGLRVGFERGRGRLPENSDTPDMSTELQPLERIGARLSEHPVTAGNEVKPLINGDETFPAMLEAIDEAARSVFLSTYIFDVDEIGTAIIERLAAARDRGVDVRVVIDGIGQSYSWPRATRRLRRAGIRTAVFLPPRLLPPRLSINLRNHHKILVVDGHTAFTGGLNIGERHVLGEHPAKNAVADIHFRLKGPGALQLETEFLRTWEFVTGAPEPPAPVSVCPVGEIHTRTMTDGPDDHMDQITQLLSATISTAGESIVIVTPYFLPPREIVGALQAASLRGVRVTLILPEKNNLPYVHWATRNMLWELLYQGVEVFYQPAPFAHTKLFVVDDRYALVGSSNWDARSLRLNFELQLEIFSPEFAHSIARRAIEAAGRGRRVTLEEVDGRSLPVRLRDSMCWLFSPYL